MMTSIIGYTRVPFNPTCSIAPVQRLCPNLKEENASRPHFHRMFSREANGIMELIEPVKSPIQNKQSGYNRYLSIDISNNFKAEEEEDIDLLKLMAWISALAYENSIKLNQIIDLLKKLQRFENQYTFPSRIDKQQQVILIYFPNTIPYSLDQWLQINLKINIKHYKNWHIQEQEEFDGSSYFKDIHKFIDQVDSLIESNALFSHNKKNQ